MSKKRKICMVLTAVMWVSLLFPCLSAGAEEAEADIEIEKVKITVSYAPVALMELKYVKLENAGAHCRVVSYGWYDDKGEEIKDFFKTGDCSLVAELAADEGYVFSEGLSARVNEDAAEFAIDDSGKNLRLRKSYTPMLWKPQVIKHPGGETVEAGGWASFVASATYANEFRWSFQSPEGEKLSPMEAAAEFPGLEVQGDGLGKIKVYGIPEELDGWKVVCKCIGPGGSVSTDGALISIKGKAAPAEPEKEPEEEKTEEPGENEHMHRFSPEWTYDEKSHWHECSCGAKSGEADHSFQWTVVKKATEKRPGEEKGVCRICGYETYRELQYEPELRDNSGLRALKGLIGFVIAVAVLCVIIFALQVRRSGSYKKRGRH